MRTFFSYLLFPITILYGIITYIRNSLYSVGYLKSKSHSLIVISVGNLKAGGTGKTPHVEYLVSVLSKKYEVAVLSRGYGRKTKGFRLLNQSDSAKTVGDEPLQMYYKFKNIPFAVCENRNKGIEQLEKLFPHLQVVILDDAFQHRAVRADISLLLTEYSSPFFEDKVIPFGMLREYKKGYKRADYLIVTKSPEVISIGDRTFFESKLKPKKYQKVFFSHIKYATPYPMFSQRHYTKSESSSEKTESGSDFVESSSIFLVTGIANNTPIVDYLKSKTTIIDTVEYPDHYNFSNKDIEKLITRFNSKKQDDTIIITTQKDAVRLKEFDKLKDYPFYVLPISLALVSSISKENHFENILLDDVRNCKSY